MFTAGAIVTVTVVLKRLNLSEVFGDETYKDKNIIENNEKEKDTKETNDKESKEQKENVEADKENVDGSKEKSENEQNSQNKVLILFTVFLLQESPQREILDPGIEKVDEPLILQTTWNKVSDTYCCVSDLSGLHWEISGRAVASPQNVLWIASKSSRILKMFFNSKPPLVKTLVKSTGIGK